MPATTIASPEPICKQRNQSAYDYSRDDMLWLKKQKSFGYLKLHEEIRNMKQLFHVNKLQMSTTLTKNAANDDLFNKQPSSKQSQYIRWVIACKFIIASSLKLDSDDVPNASGMSNLLPRNMYFYVDHQNNLCLVIQDKDTVDCSRIIAHCDKIETCIVQTYYGTDEISKYIQHKINNEENDKIWKKNIENKEEEEEVDAVHIIRVPMMYYDHKMQESFYKSSCRVTKYISNPQKPQFCHPLFQLFGRHIANFDCFQRSVPMVPLSGSLHQMFSQFACGVYHYNKDTKKVSLTSKEFVAFLGVFDCWKEMQRRQKCRRAMNKHWAKTTNTNVDIMCIVIEFADIHSLSDERVVAYINQFDTKSTRYESYFEQLKSKIHCLDSLIN